MSKPRNKSNPRCPDCGGRTIGNGTREGTTIKRWRCVGEGDSPACRRRFTDLTKDEKTDADKKIIVTRDALRDDTHVFVITWAQNATDVHVGFFAALQALVAKRDADLIVIKGTYRNPTMRNEEADDNWWDDSLPEMWDKRGDIGPQLTILGDVRVQPTAVNPLTGLDSMTGGRSGILGHPKLEMRVIPTPQNKRPKQMLTTGACTVQNYSDSKAGKKGEFHHTIGALIVEMRGDYFFARQINALRDGSFIDMDTEYLPTGKTKPAGRALALSMGDWHSGFTSDDVIEATFGIDSDEGTIVSVLKPKVLLWDDLLDQYGRNHHHIKQPFINLAKQKDKYYNRGDLADEVAAACFEVNFYTEKARIAAGGKVLSVIKASNHDDALTKYINEADWKVDPLNMEFYLETALKMAQETHMTRVGAAFPSALHVWARDLIKVPHMLLGRRDSFMVADIECGLHGDMGPNGARGAIGNFAKLGVKTIVGHTHVPGIVGGCYQSGTSTYLTLEYAQGPSSWMNSHVAVYANGKRVILTIINGEWHYG